jgi:chromate transporter
MSWVELFLVFLKASMLSSGGLAPLALLQEELIRVHTVLTDADFASAIAIGRISPGPNGLFVISIGYYAGGIAGSLAGLLALMIPGFLGIVLVRAHRRLEGRPWVTGMTRGVTVSAVGLLSAVGYSFSVPLFGEPSSALILLISLGLLLALRLDALPVLITGALVGVACYLLGIPLA